MGVRLVFYFMILLLPWLIAGESGCQETCGTVGIPFPFGIKTGCYNNSWFRVTCKKTANGPKPFISLINLELLDSSAWTDDGVIVNNPVTYINCGNKGNNSTTSPASLNLTGTPFFFSTAYNVFGSEGCGNFALVSGNNQTYPLAGCPQQRCGDLTSKFGGCYVKIPEEKNLTFYTATVTDIMNPRKKEHSKRCTSAFLFYKYQYTFDEFLQNVSIDTTHVPAMLEWNPVECDLEAALCQQVATAMKPYKSGCIESCGDVDIPFPFGIKPRCYMNPWFKVTCNETADGRKPFLSSINLQLLEVELVEGTVVVNNPITYFNCHSEDRENNGVSVNLTGSPFVFSDNDNVFASVGCGSLAEIFRSPTDDSPIDGCFQGHCGNTKTSDVSCFTTIPSDLRSFTANMTEIKNLTNGRRKSCGSVFIVNHSSLYSLETNSDHNDTSKWNRTHVPTTLQWGTRKDRPCKLTEGSNTFRSSDGKYYWRSLSPMQICFCDSDSNYGYNSSADVCQGISYMIEIVNICPNGEHSSRENMCKRKKLTSPPESPEFLTEKSDKSQNLPIIIACCTSIGTLFVLFGSWQMYKVLERRKNIKMKQKYFKRNGGLLLQQQLSSNEGRVEKIKLFASKELEKATDYYNENRILGQGGQGTVYKGMLMDGSIVAIKKSKMIEEKKSDERKLEQFINEVLILSQINHRNVVKLLGCCLETEVPLLVYEFIPNGTLSQLIHEPNEEFTLTWEKRLQIAIEIANALSYLHSAASVPIYHRDIKSSNILLDDKHKAKVSDFGTSRLVALEQTHVTTQVQGTFGYLDPEYFRSNQFTEKSDVYSFGVVLAELLTGQKPVSARQSEEVVRSLVTSFLLSMKENSLVDILDPTVMNDGPLEEILAVAKLAKRCLNLNGKKRPTMKEVALELEWIRSSEEANVIHQSVDENSDVDDMIEPSTTASCSTYSSILNNSVTLTLDA